MIFSVIPLLALYLFFRVVYPNCRGAWRWLIFLILAAGASFPTYVDFYGGGIASPTLGRTATLFGEGLLLFLLQTAIFFLIRDGFFVASWIARHPLKLLNQKKVTLGIVIFSFFEVFF